MRSAIEARVMVTRRVKPIRLNGNVLHSVGLPYHFGKRGIVTGDSTNDLLHVALDPNVHIQATKGLTCDIRPGRRPRGKALLHFMEDVRRKASLGQRT
jgi:formate dehydrogenase major subunit